MALSDQGTIVLISTLGGIITTYLTVKYKDKVIKKRKGSQPKDRMDNIFDGYERLIIQLTTDMERKEKSIHRLESIIDELDSELTKTKQLLAETKLELHESQRQKAELSSQLKAMRKEYIGNSDKTVV